LISREGSRTGLDELFKWKWELPVIFFLLVAALLAFLGTETQPSSITEEKNETEYYELEPSATYEITNSGISPYSHNFESESAVMIRNERDESVSVEGDRWDSMLDVPSGGEVVKEVDGITYFEVFVGDDVVGRGRVNVE